MLRKTTLLLATLFVSALTIASQSSSSAQTNYVYKPVLFVSGSTAPDGMNVDLVTKASTANQTSVHHLIAKDTDLGIAYVRMMLTDTAWKSQTSTACAVDWSKISAAGATVKFRVAYKTLTDLAVIKIVPIKDATGEIVKYSFDVKYTNYYGTIT